MEGGRGNKGLFEGSRDLEYILDEGDALARDIVLRVDGLGEGVMAESNENVHFRGFKLGERASGSRT